MKKPDLFFNHPEQDYPLPREERRAPARCPYCGSIDINAFGVCVHCVHCGQQASE